MSAIQADLDSSQKPVTSRGSGVLDIARGRQLWCRDVVWAAPVRKPVYRVYGMSVRSEFELSLIEDSEGGNPDVDILAAGPAFFSEHATKARFPTIQSTWCQYGVLPDGASFLRWPNLFECVVGSNGRSVVCGWLGAETMESLQVYLLGSALSHALVHQGLEPLHATVVTQQGRTVALLGECGFGKSTLAAYLLESGARLVTDDLLQVAFRQDGVFAYPGPQRIKLLPEAARRFLRSAGRGVTMNPLSGKYVIPLPERYRQHSETKLDAIYLLSWPEPGHPEHDVRVVPVSRMEAFLAVTAGTFNLSVRNADRLRRQFQFAHDLTSHVPCYRLSYPRQFSVMTRLRETVF